jgi:NTE family protein
MLQNDFDFNKEYGIVLEGGGAKGAYQIGVWKALLDYGVKIKAVAGVSVGALNGALICMGDYDRAVSLWKNISYSRIMNVDDNEMDKLISRKFRELNIQTVRNQSKKFLVGGGFDVTPLRQMIDENVDEQKIRESDIDFIVGTFNVSSLKEMDISARDTQEGWLKDYLMASANFPLFKNEKLHGKTFLDGGVTNNVPVDLLIKRGYKDIIVIRIYGIGLEKRVKIPEDVNIINIAPKVHLCNVLEFDKKKACRNISLGYFDAVRILKPLAGNEYYIESSKTEKDYMDSLMNLREDQMKDFLAARKEETDNGGSVLRKYTEEIYPQLAAFFRFGKNWDYGDLYYALLEYAAKKLRIKKYRIYSEEEFCLILLRGIVDKYEEYRQDAILELAYSILRNNSA